MQLRLYFCTEESRRRNRREGPMFPRCIGWRCTPSDTGKLSLLCDRIRGPHEGESILNRESPAAGLGFSADGSLLVAAYGCLVTLWCPNSVQLKSSFLNPGTSAIQFSAFIEPNRDAMEGGGGDSLLVLGSKRCMSVVNLMDLQHLWSITVPGSFTSWAVAGREAECLTGAKMEKGWVAVGYCYKTEAEIKVPRSSASARKKKASATTDEEVGEVGDGHGGEKAPVVWTNEVWVFDPNSATPIMKSPRTAALGRISCLAFLPSSSDSKIPAEVQTGEEAAEGGRLVVVAEEPNALFLLSAGSAEVQAEVETGAEWLPQSSAVSRKQVRLPSLSLPPSIPASAEDEEDQNRKKARLTALESSAVKGRSSELFLDGSNEHRTTAAVFERYLQLTVVPRLAQSAADKKG
eukprot:gene25033-32631_t